MWKPLLPMLAERFIEDRGYPHAHACPIARCREGQGSGARYRPDGRLCLCRTVPCGSLAIGGEKSLGEFLGQQMKLAASNVIIVVLKDTGHWVLEEQPNAAADALLKFL